MHLSMNAHCAMLTLMETGTDLVGSSESCRILDIHAATLTRWVAAGTITPAHKLPGKNGAFLFSRTDIEALAAAREQSAAESRAASA